MCIGLHSARFDLIGDLNQDKQAQRAYKSSAFVHSFEDYIIEVVTSNHGIKPEEMIKIVQDNFQRSILANVKFHGDLANNDEQLGDNVNAAYHNAMAKVYKSFLK